MRSPDPWLIAVVAEYQRDVADGREREGERRALACEIEEQMGPAAGEYFNRHGALPLDDARLPWPMQQHTSLRFRTLRLAVSLAASLVACFTIPLPSVWILAAALPVLILTDLAITVIPKLFPPSDLGERNRLVGEYLQLRLNGLMGHGRQFISAEVAVQYEQLRMDQEFTRIIDDEYGPGAGDQK